MTAAPDPEPRANFRSHQDEIHRHIGFIVRNAASLEESAMVLVTQMVDSNSPRRVRPLVQGRRLSELIDTLSQVLPDFSDKAALIKALRAVNSHRDRLAHSTPGFEFGDFTNYEVHWMDRQGRSSRTTYRLDLGSVPEVELDHGVVSRAVLALSMGLSVGSVKGVEFTSVREAVAFAATEVGFGLWDGGAGTRLTEILTGSELTTGLTAVPQARE